MIYILIGARLHCLLYMCHTMQPPASIDSQQLSWFRLAVKKRACFAFRRLLQEDVYEKGLKVSLVDKAVIWVLVFLSHIKPMAENSVFRMEELIWCVCVLFYEFQLWIKCRQNNILISYIGARECHFSIVQPFCQIWMFLSERNAANKVVYFFFLLFQPSWVVFYLVCNITCCKQFAFCYLTRWGNGPVNLFSKTGPFAMHMQKIGMYYIMINECYMWCLS